VESKNIVADTTNTGLLQGITVSSKALACSCL